MSVIPSVIEYLYTLSRKGRKVTVEMKVWGNCGKCKTRIEKAAKIKGVQKASWDIDSKMLTLTYTPQYVKLEKVHERIAMAGHDTENLYAPKGKYLGLPACCKYSRE
jgi:copper chaperone CopZ